MRVGMGSGVAFHWPCRVSSHSRPQHHRNTQHNIHNTVHLVHEGVRRGFQVFITPERKVGQIYYGGRGSEYVARVTDLCILLMDRTRKLSVYQVSPMSLFE